MNIAVNFFILSNPICKKLEVKIVATRGTAGTLKTIFIVQYNKIFFTTIKLFVTDEEIWSKHQIFIGVILLAKKKKMCGFIGKEKKKISLFNL